MGFFGRAQDRELCELVEESGRNVQRSSLLLRDLLADYPERAHLAHDMALCEQEGDRVTHDVIHRLNRARPRFSRRPRRPFDATDGHLLATALDDIVDYAEQTADTLGVYGVEAPMEQADALAEVLVGAAEQVATALRALRTGGDFSPQLVEIHWKDIFASLEAAVDACERVAHVLEGIQLKRRR